MDTAAARAAALWAALLLLLLLVLSQLVVRVAHATALSLSHGPRRRGPGA